MEIMENRNGDTLLLSLSGRMDSTTAPQLENIINTGLAGVSNLVLDFAKLDYISSAGLRVLLSAQKIMSKQGKMTIKNVCETIDEVFSITGFSDILTIEKN